MKLKDIRLPKGTKLPRKKKKARKKHLLIMRYIMDYAISVHIGLLVSDLILKIVDKKIAA